MNSTRGLSGIASRGALFAIGGQWARLLLQLIVLAVLARILLPHAFGSYAMVLAVAGLASLLTDFGLSLAATRVPDITEQQRSNLLWTNVALGVLAAGLVFLSAYPISWFYGDPSLRGICQAITPLFLIQAATAQFRAEMVRALRIARLTTCDVIASVAGAICAIAVAELGGGVWALVIQQVATALVQLVSIGLASGWRPTRPRRTEGMRALYRVGRDAGGVQLVNYLTSNVDSIGLGRTWGADVVGVYNQAFQLFRMPLALLAAPLTQMSVAVLSQTKSDAQFRDYVLRAQLVLAYLMGGGFLTAAAIAFPLLDSLLGPGWNEAPLIFTVLAAGGIFQTLSFVYYWIFVTKNLTGVQFRCALVSRGLMTIFIIVALPWGGISVAAASSVGLALNWLILSHFALPKSGISWREIIRVTRRPLILFGLMYLTVAPLGPILRGHLPSISQLVLQVCACLVLLATASLCSRQLRVDLVTLVETVRKSRKQEMFV